MWKRVNTSFNQYNTLIVDFLAVLCMDDGIKLNRLFVHSSEIYYTDKLSNYIKVKKRVFHVLLIKNLNFITERRDSLE
jgi:hypothetical protein